MSVCKFCEHAKNAGAREIGPCASCDEWVCEDCADFAERCPDCAPAPLCGCASEEASALLLALLTRVEAGEHASSPEEEMLRLLLDETLPLLIL